jgi:dienelactone hydrolase
LLVAGSPYEMGYQQGKLLGKECRELIEKILIFTRAAEASKVKEFLKIGSLEEALARSGRFIDRRYYEEMKGLADGAGIPLQDVLLANIFPELFHCSGFALFGKATEHGKLLHGRILDYMTEAGLQDYALVSVAKPNGYNAFVTVGYAGFTGTVTAMNAKQIALGQMGGRGEGHWDGMPMSFLMRKVAEESDTLEQAVELFKKTPRTCEYFYVVSDGKINDARGLACWPDKYLILEPGKSYELLPEGIEDSVLVSAGDRYLHLARLVKENYGKIDLESALDLMNRPVAMKSCLHRVLFSPEDGTLWVSNAASVSEGDYQACYQPYYQFNFKQLLEMIPATTDKDAEAIIEPEGLSTMVFVGAEDNPAKIKEEVVNGIIGETVVRRISEGSNERQRMLLAGYKEDNNAFSYKMTHRNNAPFYSIYEVSFPSSFVSPFAENNTVYCEYYKSGAEGKRPAVILLDILDGSMLVSRMLAHSLASQGTDACIMILPYYEKRRPGVVNMEVALTQDITVFVDAIRQAVFDIRRTARWLSGQESIDKEKIGICGTSLGGFVAALGAGVDGQFSRAVFLLAGGDLATVLSTDVKEIRGIKEEIARRGIDKNHLQELLSCIEPLNFSDRLSTSKVLMINGESDPIVPSECAKKLAESAGAHLQWYATDHYGMVKYMIPAVGQVCAHFSAKNW